VEIFISYSHKDVVWKDRVATFMQCMKQHGQLDYATWDDGDISPSEDWGTLIEKAIKRAKVAILLISPDFLCSKFISEVEVKWLLKQREKGELAIVPVIVRPCPWEVVDWLAPIQLHPSDGTALSSCAEHQIEEHLKQLSLETSRLVAITASDVEAPAEAEMEAQTVPDEFEFLEEEGVRDFVRERRGESALKTLLLFRTKKQRTWLVTTKNRLHCILDSQRTRESNRLLQWEMIPAPGIQVNVRDRSRIKFAGLVDIGKRQNWYYNLKLHPNSKELERRILEMLDHSRHR
jgi:hypothetical protein